MEKKYYTAERNVQIVIALLKANGIKRVIASPGTTNMTFVGSIQNDPFFEIFSSVDERSAAYLACGMAAETGEPVVLSCTGATASRNYMSGLTEAYYRKLPVLAITSHRGDQQIGHLLDQQIDRRQRPADIVMESVVVPMVKDATDAKYCTIEANKAILALKLNGGGPAHINLFTSYNSDFSVQTLPAVRAIKRHTVDNELPELPSDKRVAIFIGAHKNFSPKETKIIDNFCLAHNAAVFCDHTSNFYGNSAAHMQIVFGQVNYTSPLKSVDLLIHIGEVTGDVYRMAPQQVWRVSEDGALRDMFGCLTDVFMMSERQFFEHYTPQGYVPTSDYLDDSRREYEEFISKIPELPFGNIWMAQQMHDRLPISSELHMGIYNSLRSWNFFTLPKEVKAQCNVGGFGIDGGVSTMIGASLASPKRLIFGVFGDLAFFYDMNVLGNRHVGNNVRLMLINNGCGAEFRLSVHLCEKNFGEEAAPFMAAAGHFGNKSPQLIKHYAEDLGYEYLTASSKDEFKQMMERFITPEVTDRPMIFEVFTDKQDESDALEMLLNMKSDSGTVIKNNLRKVAGQVLGGKGVKALKTILNKS